MRILIIEDDPDIQKLLSFSLREACFAVDTADTGTDGLYLAKINEYDLIILDYMLPGKNGAEVCRELRDAGKTLPILLLSVRAETEQKVELLTCGADDYMTKPFSLDELQARIKALLRRPTTIAPKTIEVHDIAINSNSQTVHIGKKEILFTRKEFALVEYLARNKGAVVSRGMLMEHVWDKDLDIFSNTIEAHIVNVRKKLGAKGKHIVTVPGRGYKINS